LTTFTIILIIICAGAGFFIWKKNQETESEDQGRLPFEKKKLYPPNEVRIENVGAGGVIHLTNIGPEMEDFDLNVVAKHIYRCGESTWYELECDRGEEKIWLDLEEDDELELTVVLKKIKLRELGIKKNDLERFDDEEEGSFEFDGKKYYYEDSDKAVFYRNGDDKNAETYYYWDFEADDEKYLIGIEKWSNGDIDVSLSESIKPSQVTVYSINNKS